MSSVNCRRVCGIDETGRGALAGPLVIAAVVFPEGFDFSEIKGKMVVKDSKYLTPKQRRYLYEVIKRIALDIEIETISVSNINAYGINWAEFTGFKKLIYRTEAEQYIIDGCWHLPDLGERMPLVTCQIRADESIPSVLAAGVIAKVERERIMKNLHTLYPMYGWNSNTGHGTDFHIRAILEYGPNEYHRTQFVATALRNFQKRGK